MIRTSSNMSIWIKKNIEAPSVRMLRVLIHPDQQKCIQVVWLSVSAFVVPARLFISTIVSRQDGGTRGGRRAIQWSWTFVPLSETWGRFTHKKKTGSRLWRSCYMRIAPPLLHRCSCDNYVFAGRSYYYYSPALASCPLSSRQCFI